MQKWHILVVTIILCGTQTAFAQYRFESDWLFMDRDNDSSANLVGGGDSASTAGTDFGVSSGYRFMVAAAFNEIEFDASFSQLQEWDGSNTGTLSQPLVFDDTFNNAMVVPMVPGSYLGFDNSLFSAATNVLTELTEGEQLLGGSSYQTAYSSQLDDFEFNIGSNRDWNWWHVAVGVRALDFDEFLRFQVAGAFDAPDIDDGAHPGDMTNDPNDLLSHDALVGAGLTLLSGGADGYDAIHTMDAPVDNLHLSFATDAENSLVGGQFTFSSRLYPNDFVTIETHGKLGAYHNRIKGKVTERFTGFGNDDSVYGRTMTDSRSVGSFVGGAGVRAIFAVFEYVDLTIGYETLVLTNVAMGPDQFSGLSYDFSGNPTYRVQSNGDVFIHGGRAGLRVTW